MATGTIKWFNRKKGYGFISLDSGIIDVFVHISAFRATLFKPKKRVNPAKDNKQNSFQDSAIIQEGLAVIQEGLAVEFELIRQPNGKLIAFNVVMAKQSTS